MYAREVVFPSMNTIISKKSQDQYHPHVRLNGKRHTHHEFTLLIIQLSSGYSLGSSFVSNYLALAGCEPLGIPLSHCASRGAHATVTSETQRSSHRDIA